MRSAPSAAARAASTCAASPASVGAANSALSGSSTPSTRAMRDTSRVAISECPPSSKN